MKTVIHLTNFFSPHIGGVETHVAELVKELQKKNISSIVITSQHDSKLPLQEKIGKIKIYRIPVSHINSWQHKLSIWNWILNHKQLFTTANIIYAHDVTWWILPIWFNLQHKLFTTFHGWEGKYPVPVKNKLARKLWSALSVATIHVGNWIREFYWDKPTAVTYGGVTVDKRKTSIKNISKSKSLNIVFFGRLSTDNSIEKYLGLVKIISRQIPKVKVTWVGDGPYRKQCMQLGKVTGLVKKPGIYLAKANIVLSASYLSMLTAQSMGKLVCAIYSHNLKQRYLETYPGSNLMIISSSPSEAWKQISHLLKDHHKMEMFITSSSDFARHQTWEKVASVYTGLWEEVL